MNMEWTASPSMIGASLTAAAPNRARPAIKHHFIPVAEYEACMFAALNVQETLADASEDASDRKISLPRFSLLRGEVALLAERVLQITSKTA